MLNKHGAMGAIGGGILLIVLGIIMITAVALPVTVNQIKTLNCTGLNITATGCGLNDNSNTMTILKLYPLGEAIVGLGLVFGGGFLTYSGVKNHE